MLLLSLLTIDGALPDTIAYYRTQTLSIRTLDCTNCFTYRINDRATCFIRSGIITVNLYKNKRSRFTMVKVKNYMTVIKIFNFFKCLKNFGEAKTRTI